MKARKAELALAVHHDETTLLRRRYEAWTAKLAWCRKRKKDGETAVLFDKHRLLRRCLVHGLEAYVQMRRAKTRLKTRATSFSVHLIQSRVFALWIHRLQLRRRWLLRVDRASALAAVAVERRLFLHWRHFISLRHLKTEKWRRAEQYERKSLLRASLDALKLNATRMRIKALRMDMADSTFRLTTTRKAWMVWQKRLEAKEEARLYYVTREALEWRRLALLWRGWRAFGANVAAEKEAKSREKLAEDFFLATRVAKIVFVWRRFAVETREKRERKTLALSFLVEKLQSDAFAVWRSAFFRAAKLDELAVDFGQRRELTLVKDAFRTWRRETASATVLNGKMDVAAAFYRRKWMLKCWNALKTEAAAGREEWEKEDTADWVSRKNRLKRAFAAWSFFVRVVRKQLYEKVEKLRARCWRKRDLFLRWRESVMEAKEITLAVRFRDVTVAKRALTAWRGFVEVKKRRRVEEEAKTSSLSLMRDRNSLRFCFTSWWSSTTELGAERECVQLALIIHRRRLAQRVFTALTNNVAHRKRKRHLRGRGDEFLHRRLMAFWFQEWRQRATWRRNEAEKEVSAVYVWALRLQWKSLEAWKRYVVERREKKKQEAEAREKHRLVLISLVFHFCFFFISLVTGGYREPEGVGGVTWQKHKVVLLPVLLFVNFSAERTWCVVGHIFIIFIAPAVYLSPGFLSFFLFLFSVSFVS